MRQLINSTYLTLDGVIENPHLWPALKGGASDDGDTIQTDLLETCDIVLMGRRTYDVFAPARFVSGGRFRAASGAGMIDTTAASSASVSSFISGTCARIERYFSDVSTITPPSSTTLRSS